MMANKIQQSSVAFDRGPQDIANSLAEGQSVHGLTYGNWSLIDAIDAVIEKVGPSRLVIATWTAARADISHCDRLLNDQRVQDIRFLVDRSFQSRQARYCTLLRDKFGDEAIRVVNSHAKFVIFQGGAFDVLLLTSANLNKNKRIENFSFIGDTAIVENYAALTDAAFCEQAPSLGFDQPKAGRQTTAKLAATTPVVDGRERADVLRAGILWEERKALLDHIDKSDLKGDCQRAEPSS